jgi:hypothetical protein
MKTLLTKPLALILFLFFLGLSPEAGADTQYSYTGDDFTSWNNTGCPPACHITGSLTLATPLLPGLNFADVTPLSDSFTDGITTWSDIDAPGGIFEFSTDAMGNITFWIGSLAKTQDPSQCDPGSADLRFLQFESTTTFALNSAVAICATDTTVNGLYDAENTSSGMWTVSTTGGTPIPEPGTVLLLGAGLASVFGLLGRKNVWVIAARVAILILTFLCITGPAAAQNTWNGGTGSWSTGSDWSTNTSPDGSTDISIPTGTVQGDTSFTNRNILDIGAPAELNVLSTTTITSLTSSGQISNAGSLLNQGILNSDGSASILSYGSVTNSAGAQMIGFSGFNNKAGATLDNAGALEVATLDSGGTLINSSGAQLISTLEFAIGGGTVNNAGTLIANDIENSGTLSNSGALTTSSLFNGGTINNIAGTMQVGGNGSNNYRSVNNSAGAQLTITGPVVNKDGATLNNDGILNIQNSIENAGQLSNTSNGTLNNSSSLTNYQTLTTAGTLNNTGGISNAQGGTFTVLNGGTLNNSGVVFTDSQSSFGTAAGSVVLNTGTISLASSAVIGGSFRNNGTITMVAPPPTGVIPIQMPPPPLIVSSTGTLSGTGTVNSGPFGGFSAGVIMEGVMAPGDPVGTFTIDGTYTQTDTGMLKIFLGGTGVGQFGQLDVLQSATVSGKLDVELFAGFDPQASEVFEILESGGFSSFDFLSLLFPTLPDGLFFKLDQEGGNLFLDVMQGEGGGGTPTPEPGTGVLLLGAIAVGFGGSRLRKRLPAPRV